MFPLVSLNQISCTCPAGFNISLAGSWILSCSSTELKRNAVFRLWLVLWQRGPAVTLLNVDRLRGYSGSVIHAWHCTQGLQSEYEHCRTAPFFGLSCSAEQAGCSRAPGVQGIALTSAHVVRPSAYSLSPSSRSPHSHWAACLCQALEGCQGQRAEAGTVPEH